MTGAGSELLTVVGLVMPLFSLVLIGYLSGRWVRLPIEGLAWLNFFVVYISLPALFFRLLSQTPVEQFTNLRFLATTTFGTFLVFTLGFALTLLFRRGDVRVATIQGFAGAYGNIGYMGPPLALAAFGAGAGVPVALVFCLDNAMHFTLAPLLMSMGEAQRQSPLRQAVNILRRIFTHPFILATIAGIVGAWYQYRPPVVLDQLLGSLSGAAAPCALFAMGVTAALRPLRRVPADLLYLIPIKLVVHPLVMYLLLTQLPGLDPVWLYSAVLLAALPSATNVFVLAQSYQVWEQRASSAVVLSTLFSTVTVTLFIYLARQQWV